MMVFYCLYSSILCIFYLTYGNCLTCNKVMLENLGELVENSEELVVELGGGMGTSDHIEPVGVEACICKSAMAIIYLWEGGLLPFTKRMIKCEENILM